jgi:hypothetical protein
MLQILIESGANWNIKNNFSNFDFFDLLYNEDEEIIIEDYPDKYKDYLMKKDADKYNL